jgi:hypothetical protein
MHTLVFHGLAISEFGIGNGGSVSFTTSASGSGTREVRVPAGAGAVLPLPDDGGEAGAESLKDFTGRGGPG